MAKRKAHILSEKWRSNDIKIEEGIEFSSFLLPDEILKGLSSAGFKYPSPIQLEALPFCRSGRDLIVQAKSGTGKTLVFTIAALNILTKGAKHPQVIIMAPTREIACQISQIISCVGSAYKGLKCDYFIGGRKLEEDVQRIEGCQIVVGTPGRIKHLITYKILNPSGIRLFVLDEGDQLLREQSFIKDMDIIFRTLPRDKQIIATSATYPDKLHRISDKYFREPALIRLNKEKIGLLGMVHYYHVIPLNKLPVMAYKLKLEILEKVLLSVKFGQCLVFCNMVSRVENLCVEIKNMGFAATFISSARTQEERLKAIERLKRCKCKVLISSDVSARGIDAENVDLVINFDLPTYMEVYFHRSGRAGRYGSKCVSISFFTSDEIAGYRQLLTNGKFKAYPLPDPIPADLISVQPKTKPDDELLLDDGNQSISDLSSDAEDQNENGDVEANNFIESINGKSTLSFKSSNDTEDVKGNGNAQQENTNNFSENIELNSHGESTSSSNSDKDAEELYENGSFQQEKTNGFIQDGELNGHNKLSCISKVDDFPSENLTNIIDERLADSILENTKSSNSYGIMDQIFDLNYNPTSSKDVLSSTSQCVEVELQKSDLTSCIKLNRQKETTEVKIPVEEENKKLKVSKSSDEKSCVNQKPIEKKLDQQNCTVTETTKNCYSSNTCGLQQITNKNSCLVDLESCAEKSLTEITINDKSLVMNKEYSVSKNLNSESKDLISKVTTFIEEYENCYKDFLNHSISDSIESSQSLNVKSNKFSPVSLMSLQSNLGQYYYNVYKKISADISEDLSEEMALECRKVGSVNQEIRNQNNSRQDDAENKIQDHELQPPLFSTPKAEVLSGSSYSSDQEASGSDIDKLIEKFNAMCKNETDHENIVESDSSADREEIIMLYKELKKNAVNHTKSSVNHRKSSSSKSSVTSTFSDSDTSTDSKEGKANPKKEIGKKMQNGKSEMANSGITSTFSDSDTSTDSKEGKANPKKEIGKKMQIGKGEMANSGVTSTFSDSDTSTDSKEGKVNPKKEIGKKMQNGKSEMANYGKYSKESGTSFHSECQKKTHKKGEVLSKTTGFRTEGKMKDKLKKNVNTIMRNGKKVANMKVSSKSSSYKTKTVNGPTQNKITYYYSECEGDTDQNSLESQSSHQEGYQRKTHKNEMQPKTDCGCRKKTSNGSAQNKITHYSETENDDDQCSNDSHSNLQVVCQRKKTDKKNEMLLKIEPSKFDNEISNPYFNLSTERPIFDESYSSSQIRPSYASGPYNRQFFQQNQANPEECHPGYQMHPSSYASGPYNRQFFQQNQAYPEAGHPHYKIKPSYDAVSVYNELYSQKSQNGYNECVQPSSHPCHPPNDGCQSPACATWYDIFHKQWQFFNQSQYF